MYRLFVMLALLLCASCERSSPSLSQTLRLNLSDDPVSLDPRVVRSLKDLTVVKQLFDGLMRLDSNGIPQPAIAASFEVSEDLLIYTFHLREAYWTNGDPVTANDFAYAWTTVLDPHFATDYSHMLYPIKNAKQVREGKCPIDALGITVIDTHTLSVELEAPTPYFVELTAFPTYFPVHRDGASSICNGPFRVKKWDPQSEIYLIKNSQYWDCGAVQLEALCFSIIGDSNTESQLFEKNALDWLGQPISQSIGAALMSKMKNNQQLHSYPVAGTFWFKFNTEKAPFNDNRLRKAFSYAINREEIIQHILQGDQPLATGPLPPSMQMQSERYFQDGNIEQAKILFEEVCAGYEISNETFPTIVIHYFPSDRNTKIVQLVQQQWQKAFNVAIGLEAIEREFYQRTVRQGLYQVGIGDWIADFNDPLAFLELFKDGNSLNDTGWHNAVFGNLLEKSLTERDSIQRNRLLHQAEKILVEEMPIAPVYHYAFDYMKKNHVSGVILSPLGIADFKYAVIQ